MLRRLPIVLLLLPITLGAAPSATGPAPSGAASLPTTADIQKQIDDAQYRDALRNILRVLELKGTAAAPYNRPEIYLLQAECQLQLRQVAATQTALDAAVKEARGTGNPPGPANPSVAGRAWALSALITKSPNMLYTPRNHTQPVAPKPISILDRATRPAACRALFEDFLADVKAKVRATEGVSNMAPILDAAKSVAALHALEQAGLGSDVESRALAEALTTRAATLLSVSIGNMQSSADAIARGANLIYTVPLQQRDVVSGALTVVQVSRRRGLVNDEAGALKGMQQTCGQIATACGDLHLALDSAETFGPLAQEAAVLGQKAGKILSDDYSRTVP